MRQQNPHREYFSHGDLENTERLGLISYIDVGDEIRKFDPANPSYVASERQGSRTVKRSRGESVFLDELTQGAVADNYRTKQQPKHVVNLSPAHVDHVGERPAHNSIADLAPELRMTDVALDLVNKKELIEKVEESTHRVFSNLDK